MKNPTDQKYIDFINTHYKDAEIKKVLIQQIKDGSPEARFVLYGQMRKKSNHENSR